MIVISMVLVIIAFTTLMLGVLNITIADVEPLTFVYVSIAACLLAGLFLAVGVLRSRPSRKPAVAAGDKGQEPSWSGASLWQPDGVRESPRRRRGPDGGAGAEGSSTAPEAAPADTERGSAGTVEVTHVETRVLAVPGVGPAKLRALLEHFGSHAALTAAGVEDIAAVKGVSDALAQRIHNSLRE